MNHDANEPMLGSDILVERLARHGVEVVFAYPGGASMPIHQALTRFKDRLRTILPRHEQGGGFAAEGYARTTGKVGVCIATSGPGATNFVTCLADAKMDSHARSSPSPARSARPVIGTDAFQETPIVEVCRGHHQAPLPGDAHRGHPARRQGGVPHRHDRPARARSSSTCPRTCRCGRSSSRLGPADEPARLPARPPRDRGAARAGARPDPPEPSKPIIYAGGGIIASGAAAAPARRSPRRPASRWP